VHVTTTQPQEKQITLNGLRLRYLDWGTPGKTPLVCLHGHTGQARIWDEFALANAAQYHVLAVDQRGHGESEWAADGYERERFVEDLSAFIDALALDRVVLSGLSMGGWNSLLYAHQHPNRVERIILVDIAPESSEESRRQMANRPPTPLGFVSFEEAFAWARQGNPWATDARLQQDLADRLRQREDGQWVWKADPALFNTPLRDGQDEGLIARYWKAVEEIPCPILLVRGLESPLVSDDIIERMRKLNPRIESVDVVGAGHVVTVDKPQEFIAATRAFLAAAG
jgi:pimeloyl-ACP methyl ester carboxylesterase